MHCLVLLHVETLLFLTLDDCYTWRHGNLGPVSHALDSIECYHMSKSYYVTVFHRVLYTLQLGSSFLCTRLDRMLSHVQNLYDNISSDPVHRTHLTQAPLRRIKQWSIGQIQRKWWVLWACMVNQCLAWQIGIQ